MQKKELNTLSISELKDELRSRMDGWNFNKTNNQTTKEGTMDKVQGKHTDGPWSTTPTINQGIRVHQDNEHGMRDAICDLEHWQTPAETEANARLIAAAPELLEACKEVLVEWQKKLDLMPQIIDSPAIKLVKQAISKAEGQ